MKRVYQLLLGLTLLSLAFAQPPLPVYREAKKALARSVAAMPEDAVASLDALRQARNAFTPLGEGLEPTLWQGLEETFSRAEQAIVNESQIDLRVQSTVLLGGFQRSLYEQALERAASGDLAQAKAFLEVLATDLQLSPRQFEGERAQSLQTDFEQRLATRSLTELTALSELPATDRGSIYARLSQLYSYVFVVQDSPRLPAQTHGTIVEAIRLHIAREPLESNLSALRAQLQSFQSAAAAAQPGEAAPVAADPVAVDPVAVDPAAAEPITPLPQENNSLRHYLFMAAGLLALIAIVGLLARLRGSASPWQDAATVLLLLPALAEGVFALAQRLAPPLKLPLLAQAQSFSLFTNPVTQLITGLLIVCAALCLVLARRAVPTASVGQTERPPHPEPTVPPQTKTPSRSPLAAPGKINWDEDF